MTSDTKKASKSASKRPRQGAVYLELTPEDRATLDSLAALREKAIDQRTTLADTLRYLIRHGRKIIGGEN